MKTLAPTDPDIPFMGPPVLHDMENHLSISQMPAIALYVAPKLNVMPSTHADLSLCLKTIMDCNDVLMEICRYNGSMMWQREQWREFRDQRLPHWMAIFEESIKRGTIGNNAITFADIGVYALFGNMIRCLPELEPDLLKHAPNIHELCLRIGAQPPLAKFIEEEASLYEDLYCGGQIEASIREMLALDSADL